MIPLSIYFYLFLSPIAIIVNPEQCGHARITKNGERPLSSIILSQTYIKKYAKTKIPGHYIYRTPIGLLVAPVHVTVGDARMAARRAQTEGRGGDGRVLNGYRNQNRLDTVLSNQ